MTKLPVIIYFNSEVWKRSPMCLIHVCSRFGDYQKAKRMMFVHQSLLTFVQRYKNELTKQQKDDLENLVRYHKHQLVTPEILRELRNSQKQGKKEGAEYSNGIWKQGDSSLQRRTRCRIKVCTCPFLEPFFIMEKNRATSILATEQLWSSRYFCLWSNNKIC